MNTNDIHVEYHRAGLTHEADAERLAATRRRQHLGEHARHPTLPHAHAPAGVRRSVGRFLIGLGTAIAGSGPEAGARHTA